MLDSGVAGPAVRLSESGCLRVHGCLRLIWDLCCKCTHAWARACEAGSLKSLPTMQLSCQKTAPTSLLASFDSPIERFSDQSWSFIFLQFLTSLSSTQLHDDYGNLWRCLPFPALTTCSPIFPCFCATVAPTGPNTQSKCCVVSPVGRWRPSTSSVRRSCCREAKRCPEPARQALSFWLTAL